MLRPEDELIIYFQPIRLLSPMPPRARYACVKDDAPPYSVAQLPPCLAAFHRSMKPRSYAS